MHVKWRARSDGLLFLNFGWKCRVHEQQHRHLRFMERYGVPFEDNKGAYTQIRDGLRNALFTSWRKVCT